jgi:hypothetical protein
MELRVWSIGFRVCNLGLCGTKELVRGGNEGPGVWFGT